ncbi:MAG: TlpA disulfide reductase family protein [Isosphaeraceae bacterium]|nr:TlpA disulfide reductase family protein [Isosphaeraceae bacterium]
MTRTRTTLVLALFAGLIARDARAGADDEVDARQRLEAIAKAYQNAPAYCDNGELRIAVAVDRETVAQRAPFRLTLVRPNLFKLETEPVTAVSDGKSMSTSVTATKRFSTAPAPSTLSLDTFRSGPLGSALFGGPTDRLAFIPLNFLVGESPVKTLLAELDAKPRIEGEREVEGTRFVLLLLDAEKGPDYRLLVDPATNLLAAIEVVFDPKDSSSAFPGETVAVERIEWRAGRVETMVAKDAVAGYRPPEGYTKVEPFDKVAGAQAEAPKHRVEDLLGRQAPNFSLTVIDPAGKFETVTRDDLTGKVVMLDFWATWCGPCLAELPEVQKMIEAYAKEKKEVVIIALSEDQRPSELAEVRKLVEKTLGEKKIALAGNAVGKIALDPSGTIGEAFQIEGLPTVVILDGKGIVQAAHVGFRPDVRETLTRDIDALLEGKSLVKAKPKAKD